MKWICLGILIFTIAICLFVAYQVSKERVRNAQSHFESARKAAAAQLSEKANAKEKEMTAEVEKKIETIKKKQEKLKDDYEKEEQQFNNYKNSLKEKLAAAQDSFTTKLEEKQRQFEERDSELAEERHQRNLEEIAKEQQEHQILLAKLSADYEKEKTEINHDFLAFRAQIDTQKETLEKEIKDYEKKQEQLIARFKKDEEIRNERNFYKISLDSAAVEDIKKLKSLAVNFHNANAIYKLIWEVYYKTPMEAMFKRVLGNNADKGGIYKITNINNEKVYIGRSVKLLERWRIHSKRGCGIEKINGLLYDAMFEEGLENFTFEVLEVCPKEEQSEKEKYWISFYKSNSYGYNIVSGG